MNRQPLMPEVLDGFDAALGRRRRRSWFVPRALGTGLLVLAAGGTAVAAVAPEVPWNPFRGDPHAPVTLQPPPADQAATLAVLRRPQVERDHGPLVTAWLERYKRGAFREGKIRIGYIRFLRDVEVGPSLFVGGRSVGASRRASLYLIPQDTRHRDPRAPKGYSPQEFCVMGISDAWPAGDAPPDWLGAANRKPHAPAPKRPASLQDRVTGGGTCGSAHIVRVKGLNSGIWGRVHGIVPDGVAFVRAQTRDGQPVTSRVQNNAYELLAPGRNLPQDGSDTGRGAEMRPPKSGQFKSGTYEWLDASGRVIRHMPY